MNNQQFTALVIRLALGLAKYFFLQGSALPI